MNLPPLQPCPVPPCPHWTEPVSREETLARREKFQMIGWFLKLRGLFLPPLATMLAWSIPMMASIGGNGVDALEVGRAQRNGFHLDK